jgi:hypothetical protein
MPWPHSSQSGPWHCIATTTTRTANTGALHDGDQHTPASPLGTPHNICVCAPGNRTSPPNYTGSHHLCHPIGTITIPGPVTIPIQTGCGVCRTQFLDPLPLSVPAGRRYLGRALLPLNFDSEFPTVSILAPLLSHHPNWHTIESILTHGSHFQAQTLSKPDHLRQIELTLEFRNHKAQPHTATQAPGGRCDPRLNLPVTLDIARKIPGLVLSPMNIACQNTIDSTGCVIERHRLTHDHSYDLFPKSSINKCCNLDLHKSCMFRRAMSQMLHWIVYLRG